MNYQKSFKRSPKKAGDSQGHSDALQRQNRGNGSLPPGLVSPMLQPGWISGGLCYPITADVLPAVDPPLEEHGDGGPLLDEQLGLVLNLWCITH
jgi:hypothetical protein